MAVRFLLLRCWVGLVGIVAVVNALQCFFDPKYTSRRLYTLDPQQGIAAVGMVGSARCGVNYNLVQHISTKL